MAINFPTSLDTATELPSPAVGAVIPAADDTNRSLAIIALETKLGIVDSTPTTTNKILYGSATGSSTWGTPAQAGVQAELAEGPFVDTDKTKLDYLTVTQAVDLDAIETRVNALDASVILMGSWDASVGTFPGGGTAQAGESWIISVDGTVDSIPFKVGDRIIAILDNASTSIYASNWLKADYSDVFTELLQDTTPQLGGALDGQGNDLNNLGVVFLTEQAEAEADVAGKGQIWVDTATPNVLKFTDDVGTDFQLSGLTYTEISGNDGATDITGAELEELTDGSESTLHSHAGGGSNPFGANIKIAASGGDYTTLGAYFAATPASGDIVYIEPGTYTESSNWTNSTTNLTIIGSSYQTTTLTLSSVSNYTMSGAGFHIEGITLAHTANGQFIISGTDAHFHRMKSLSSNSTANRVSITGARGFVTDSFFDGQNDSAAPMWNFGGTQQMISGNHFDIGDATSSTTYGQVHVTSSGGNPSTFTGNTIVGDTNMNSAGTILSSFNDTIIVGNGIYGGDTTQGGYYAIRSAGGVVSNNYLYGHGGAIRMNGRGTISGNTIQTLDSDTISVIAISSSGGRSTITGNSISANTTGHTGIDLESGADNCVIMGNVVQACLVGVNIAASTNDNNTVIGNNFDGCTTDISDTGTGTFKATATDADPLNHLTA